MMVSVPDTSINMVKDGEGNEGKQDIVVSIEPCQDERPVIPQPPTQNREGRDPKGCAQHGVEDKHDQIHPNHARRYRNNAVNEWHQTRCKNDNRAMFAKEL